MPTINEADSADYYSYQERVLLSPPPSHQDFSPSTSSSSSSKNSFWNVRLESYSQWSDRTWAHPFGKNLEGTLRQFPQVTRILIQSSSAPSNSYASSSVAGTTSALDHIPAMGGSSNNSSSSNTQPPSHLGPSGVWIRVHIQEEGETISKQKKVELILSILSELAERRLVAAPIRSAKTYDILEEGKTGDGDWVFQVTLPTDGASFSADALEQSFRAWTPCNTNGMLSHSTELSNVLLGNFGGSKMTSSASTRSTMSRRSMWLDLTSTGSSSSSPTWTSSQGVQYSIPHTDQMTLNSWSQWILPGTTISPNSCPLADAPIAIKVVVPSKSLREEEKDHDSSSSTSSSPEKYHLIALEDALQQKDALLQATSTTPSFTTEDTFSVSKVARRPHGMANRGRLETVIWNDHSDCLAQVELRDIVPSFVTPQWRTLQAFVVETENGHKKTKGTPISPIVEWRTIPGEVPQHDAILSVTTQLEPHTSLWVTLDYDPAFLSFEEFPGDPNRGMELAPSTVTVTCRNHRPSYNNNNSNYYHLYSNTVLILPPVPDMSMPFNVTSLTCSLYAYVVGTIVALVVKKSSERIRYKLHPEERPKAKLVLLKERLRQKGKDMWAKFQNRSNESDNDSKNHNENPPQEPSPGTTITTSGGETT